MVTPRDEAAVRLVVSIHAGDVLAVRELLSANPELAVGSLGGRVGSRTALHVVTDWPGYFPNGPEIVRVLIAAGADASARPDGDEAALHWAASSDDSDVAEALIDGGADLEAPDGSIGTPLDNAVGYGCWNVARLLVARGARVDKPWLAAALGLLGPLEQLLGQDPSPEDVSQAFWHACAGAQRRAAEYLLSRGADLSWEPDYAHGTAADAATGVSTRRQNVISWLQGLGALPAQPET